MLGTGSRTRPGQTQEIGWLWEEQNLTHLNQLSRMGGDDEGRGSLLEGIRTSGTTHLRGDPGISKENASVRRFRRWSTKIAGGGSE